MIEMTQIRDIAESKISEVLELLTERTDKELFEAVVANLLDFKNKLRINNFAYAAREFIRIYIDKVAPDEQVLTASWIKPCHLYRPTGSSKDKPTRVAKMHYAIHKNLPPDFVQKELNLDVDDTLATLKKNIDVLSKYTHLSNFPVAYDSSIIAIELIESLYEFMKLFFDTQSFLTEHLEKQLIPIIQEELAFNSYFDDIDILATHHWVEDVWVDSVSINEFGHTDVTIEVTGAIDYGLQWGSNSDVKNDMGLRSEKSVEFTCHIRAQTPTLKQFEILEKTIHLPAYHLNIDDE